eukprot:TRINITY_DN3538_c0_g1_i1.p3 TRINITY_DN3538_c0_g1~~TRINITY_DN3538_c0_g1_i1.p3  ORF type:complete len:145 (+),score=26.19 TRINITY_DN3538_c0_g1_i1:197-631(+)
MCIRDRASSMEEIAKQCNIDLIFIKQFLQKFYQASPIQENQVLYNRSQSLKDKFICYALVLALNIFGYKMDGSQLALSLKIDKRKIIDYARDVGCNVRVVVDNEGKSEQNYSLTQNAFSINMELKAPLKLVKLKEASKKKKNLQ